MVKMQSWEFACYLVGWLVRSFVRYARCDSTRPIFMKIVLTIYTFILSRNHNERAEIDYTLQPHGNIVAQNSCAWLAHICF